MSVFPFIQTVKTADSAQELPLFREWAYDYNNNTLLTDGSGKNYLVSGNDALKVWIYKALHTPRFRHIAYSRGFGNELQNIYGYTLDDTIKSEIKRYITEAIMCNPYINEITDISFEFSGTRLTVIIRLVTVYGVTELENVMEV